jgi:hypothetical protein
VLDFFGCGLIVRTERRRKAPPSTHCVAVQEGENGENHSYVTFVYKSVFYVVDKVICVGRVDELQHNTFFAPNICRVSGRVDRTVIPFNI